MDVPRELQASIVRRTTLEGVSAASGIELSPDGRAFVCGDNSNFLYELGLPKASAASLTPLRRIRMMPKGSVDEEIPKKVKPDFEAIAAIPLFDAELRNVIFKASDDPAAARGCVAAIGSGSKAGVRDFLALVDVQGKDGEEPVSQLYIVTALMDVLRADKRVTGDAKLNLEACTLLGPSTIAFFNRGNVAGGRNSVVLMDLEALRLFLIAVRDQHGRAHGPDAAGETPLAVKAALPCYSVVWLELPPIIGPDASGKERVFRAGVSGASTITLPVSPDEAAHGCAATSVADERTREGALASGIEDTLGIGKGSGGRTVALPLETEARLASSAAGLSHDSEVHHHQPHHLPHRAPDVASTDFVLLSASYEGTDNEIDDGPVLGSRVALLPVRSLLRHAPSALRMGLEPDAALSGSPNAPVLDVSGMSALIVNETSVQAPGAAAEAPASSAIIKVEGVAASRVGFVDPVTVDILCVAVTDPDGSPSELVEVSFKVPLDLLKAAVTSGLATKS